MKTLDTKRITVLDFDRTSMQKIAILDHVHDLAGNCRKNRSGPKCTNRLDNQKIGMLQ